MVLELKLQIDEIRSLVLIQFDHLAHKVVEIIRQPDANLVQELVQFFWEKLELVILVTRIQAF